MKKYTCMITEAFIAIRNEQNEDEHVISINKASILDPEEIAGFIIEELVKEGSSSQKKILGEWILPRGDYLYTDVMVSNEENIDYSTAFQEFCNQVKEMSDMANGRAFVAICGGVLEKDKIRKIVNIIQKYLEEGINKYSSMMEMEEIKKAKISFSLCEGKKYSFSDCR